MRWFFACGSFFVAGFTSAPAQTYIWTTLAGLAGGSGSADGVGGAARFHTPTGIAVDDAGSVYVTDGNPSSGWDGGGGSHTIRKISPAGVVTTLAGSPGVAGNADGSGSVARFRAPFGVTVDSAGRLYVTDRGNHTVRKISPAGEVTTLAGNPSFGFGYAGAGYADGVGGSARFSFPRGAVVDGGGNVYVADGGNRRIRRISPSGEVTTLAGGGAWREDNSIDGSGTSAVFWGPRFLALDRAGNVVVADVLMGEDYDLDNRIRRVTPQGVVTTLAGGGLRDYVDSSPDGIGLAARFDDLMGVTVDCEGNTFVVDMNSGTIRKMSPAGVVTTVGGRAEAGAGGADGIGSDATFFLPCGIAVDRAGNLYVADSGNHTIRKGVPDQRLVCITVPPQPRVVALHGRVALSVSATGGGPLSYQWQKDGIAMPGATNASLQIARATSTDTGVYAVVVRNAFNFAEPGAVTLQVAPGGLRNFSARAFVPVNGKLKIGFRVVPAVGLVDYTRILVRAVGPQLASFGLAGLADPRLSWREDSELNDDWWNLSAGLSAVFAAVGAFPLTTDTKSAAYLFNIYGGDQQVVQIGDPRGSSGTVLAELYDYPQRPSICRLANLSALGFVGTGANVLVAGFVLDTDEPKQLLIRAVGPGLAQFGVHDTLVDPQFTVTPLSGSTLVAGNDNWDGLTATSTIFTQAGAFALPPGSKDAALVVRLSPGGYTVVVSGTGNPAGTVLVEIYDLDP